MWLAGFRHVGGEIGVHDTSFLVNLAARRGEGRMVVIDGWRRVGRGPVVSFSRRRRVANGGDAKRRPVVAGEREKVASVEREMRFEGFGSQAPELAPSFF